MCTDANRLITADDLAAYLGVPVRTIYTWRYKGIAPPAAKVGKYLRFRKSDVDAWLEELTTGPTV